MTQLVIQMPSQERLMLLEELAIQLGATVVKSAQKAIVRTKAKEKPFVELSVSSLEKDWNSPEDEEWDSVLEQMQAI
jgi:hypothetical protein